LAASSWNARGNCGLVVGATYPAELAAVATIARGLPILIPGAGAQGGDVEASARAAGDNPFVVNSSRGIIYAGNGPDFADAARRAALSLRDQIEAVAVS